jgi:cytochrome c
MRLTEMLFVAAVTLAAPLTAHAQETPATPQSATPEDVAAGEQAFKVCTACHSIGPEATNRMGPILNDVVGRPAASQSGFSYSQALMKARDGGLVWTPDKIEAFIENPRMVLPGTKMSFAGIKDEARRHSIIAYLETFSPSYRPAEGGQPASAGTKPSQ